MSYNFTSRTTALCYGATDVDAHGKLSVTDMRTVEGQFIGDLA